MLLAASDELAGTLQDQADDAVLQNANVEVDEKAEMKSREPEVRNHLRRVDWRQALNSLYLDQHTLLDNQIDPVSRIDSSPLVTEWKRPFSIDSPAALQYLPTKTLPVG